MMIKWMQIDWCAKKWAAHQACPRTRHAVWLHCIRWASKQGREHQLAPNIYKVDNIISNQYSCFILYSLCILPSFFVTIAEAERSVTVQQVETVNSSLTPKTERRKIGTTGDGRWLARAVGSVQINDDSFDSDLIIGLIGTGTCRTCTVLG